MSVVFSANQISGFAGGSTNFTLNNPSSLVASRIDNSDTSNYEVLLYGLNQGAEVNPQTILSGSQAADPQSITQTTIISGQDWTRSEGRSIPTSSTIQAGALGKVNTPNFSSIINTGEFRLKIRANGQTSELDAINYEASANGLVATFANGVKIQLSSPNTAIHIRRYDLENGWGGNSDNGQWAQDLKYSAANYSQSIDTIARADPSTFPIGDSVTISAPVEDDLGRIKVAFQFPSTSSTFGINSANPLIKQDERGNYVVLDKGDYKTTSFFPSYEELQASNLDPGDYPWYGAYTEDPNIPGSNESQPLLYLNGALGLDRTDQYDTSLTNGTLNNLDSYNRFPDVVGVEGDAFGNFQFVVTLKVPKETVFRPKGGGYDPNNPSYTDFQKSDNTVPGALNGFEQRNDGTYEFKFSEDEEIEFYNPDIATGMLKTVENAGESLSFSEWYKNWWAKNTLRDGQTSGGFPWTGRGYTYDPFYPTDAGWNENPSIGPGVGELVQSWRPDGADKADWMYEILDVQTIPEALGASQTALGADWTLNIKRLGDADATIYIYEADSITGLLNTALPNTAPSESDQNAPVEGQYLYPSDDNYLQKAIEYATQQGTTIKSTDLPDWGEEMNYTLGKLSTEKNYGFVIDVNGELFGSYGDTANQFIGLSNMDSSNQSSFSIGFEDTKLGLGDNDFNDLIFTISNGS